MSNLLRADFFRLWRSKSFWACMIFQVGTGAFVRYLAICMASGIPFPILSTWMQSF